MLRFRLADEGAASSAVSVAPTRSLLLCGGVNAEDDPFLEPAFVVDAPPLLPDSAGEYEIAGRTADGSSLFSLSFAMPEVADGNGRSSFAFTVPVRAGWAGNLASITLSGPGGTATLNDQTERPMAILRHSLTGQVHGILRDVQVPSPTQADGTAAAATLAPGLEVLFSRGIPDSAAWRR